MTADDGYAFYFGGSLKTLEIGFSSSQYPGILDSKGGQINAWYLTKVVAVGCFDPASPNYKKARAAKAPAAKK